MGPETPLWSELDTRALILADLKAGSCFRMIEILGA